MLYEFLREDRQNKKILVLGSGALSIGQAGEFDYSGSQVLKAIEEEGFKTVLINPNIATVQTEPNKNRKVYLYPVEPHWVKKVILKEKPVAIVAGFGGQTALNCVLELEDFLKQESVINLGTALDTLRLTEDRKLFAQKMQSIDVKIPVSHAVNSIDDAMQTAKEIGYPVIVRAAYALGGLGSGFASNETELKEIVAGALNYSPQVLIEKSLKGWKEIEYEVMRDSTENTITICNMENIDPLGVHTGDSIVIAPSQTLTDTEYQILRSTAIKIVEALGIVGECNVQYALDPQSREFYVIEVNARLSRSSALASKATGYPIAYIAGKLVLGYSLLELKNPVTNKTTAFFEPAMDYVVIKVPRWDLKKFTGTSRRLGSSMKSVGEVMSIGRNFAETIQKAIRMATESELGISVGYSSKVEHQNIIEELSYPTDSRIFSLFSAFRMGFSIDEVYNYSKIDKWFLSKIKEIVEVEQEIVENARLLKEKLPDYTVDSLRLFKDLVLLISSTKLAHWKKMGFSDKQIVFLLSSVLDLEENYNLKEFVKLFREYRISRNVIPFVKKIDTTAAEYPAESNYLYLSYDASSNDIKAESDKSIVILGSGAYRIGSSVEFDWCAVTTALTVRDNNYKSIMINCNPETVSTDYNTADSLYFEELSIERILDIYDFEHSIGMITSMGGQLPNNLTDELHYNGVKLLGHSNETVNNAEDRSVFSKILDEIGVMQPRWTSATSVEEMEAFLNEVSFPVIVRPSFVLSGTAMKVANSIEDLREFLQEAADISAEHPVVISEFLEGYREVELDGVAQQGRIVAYFISEHLENAGVHSGDATLIYPAQKLYVETVRRVRQIGEKIVKQLKLNGPFNMQFLARDNNIKVIECNARASRTFPFISKVSGVNLAKISTDVFLSVIDGRRVDKIVYDEYSLPRVGVKAPMFSFSRMIGADPILGVEMSSTGEVGCIASSFEESLLLALESTNITVPRKGILLSSGKLQDKIKLLEPVKKLVSMGIPVYATPGSADFLKSHGISVKKVLMPLDNNQDLNALDVIKQGLVDFVINIPKNHDRLEIKNGAEVRKTAVRYKLPLITNTETAVAFLKNIGTEIRDVYSL